MIVSRAKCTRSDEILRVYLRKSTSRETLRLLDLNNGRTDQVLNKTNHLLGFNYITKVFLLFIYIFYEQKYCDK